MQYGVHLSYSVNTISKVYQLTHRPSAEYWQRGESYNKFNFSLISNIWIGQLDHNAILQGKAPNLQGLKKLRRMGAIRLRIGR